MTRLVRAEFTKLATTRLIYGLAAAMAAFAVLTVAANILDRQGAPPLSADNFPMLVAGPVTLLSGAALLLGILGMATEFRHQTVTQTFLVTPDRGRVVAAKLIAYPLAGIALALTTLALTAAVSTAWLAAKGITPSLADPDSSASLAWRCSAPDCAAWSAWASPPWSATRSRPWSAWRSGSCWSKASWVCSTPPAWASGYPAPPPRPRSPAREPPTSPGWPGHWCSPAMGWRWRWPAPG
jgi:hypothetical protein